MLAPNDVFHQNTFSPKSTIAAPHLRMAARLFRNEYRLFPTGCGRVVINKGMPRERHERPDVAGCKEFAALRRNVSRADSFGAYGRKQTEE